MDVAFVQRLAEELAQGTIVLAGPEADPDPALFRSHNVARLGPVAFEQLPVLAREAAVLVMPYADLAVTRAMQPLKLKEYLATSKPVVVRDLPATRPWADGLDLVQAPDAFAQAVRQRIQSGLPDEQRHARLGLVKESWAEKARAFERWAILPAASDRGPAAVASEAAPRSSPSPAG
jgi:glycosyltransferase involved in cell wall biosynthesis